MNSKESIKNAIAGGATVIELDVCLTSDGEPVLSHRFEPDGEIMFDGKPTLPQFLRTPLPHNNTAMSLKNIVTDYKDWNGYFLLDCAFGTENEVISWLETNSSQEMNKRIIFQVHDTRLLKKLAERKLFGYLHYNADVKTLENIVSVLASCGVHSVSVDDHEIKDGKILSKLNEAGIHVFAYTVNHKRRFDFLMEAGVSGVFSDRLYLQENL